MNRALTGSLACLFLFALQACGKQNSFQAQKNLAQQTDDLDGKKPSEKTPVTEKDTSTEPTPVINSPQAETPAVVAGASLTCSQTATDKIVSCRIFDATSKPYVKPKDTSITWQFIHSTGNVLPLTAKTVETEKAGTYYFLDYGNHPKGMIQANLNSPGRAEVLLFDMGEVLDTDPIQSVVVGSVPAATNLPAPFMPTAFLFGDEEIASEKDPCLTAADVARAKTNADIGVSGSGSVAFANAVTGLSVYITDICGLQTDSVYAFIQFPKTGNMMLSKLTPALSGGKITLRAFQNVSLPAGAYAFGVMSNTPDENGRRDSLTIGGILLRDK